MTLRPESDVIIAGAGAAGLSLAWRLSKSSPDLTINLVDENFSPSSDRTWCYWDESAILDPAIVKKSWKKLQLAGRNWKVTETLQQHTYFCTGSEQYHRVLMGEINKSSAISCNEGKIFELVAAGNDVNLNTESGVIRANWAFQSVKRPDFGMMISRSRNGVLQHFLGWEIETNTKVFDPDTAILMDYRCTQEHGLGFVYVLPFSESQALVEFTLFTPHLVSKETYTSALSSYLETVWQLDKNTYSITRTESGIIPMISGYWQPGSHPRLVNIGMAAGLPKASTGYAFSRIQKDIKLISQLIEAGKQDAAWVRPNQTPFRYRHYDRMILHIMRYEPEKIPDIFRNLFEKNGFDTMLNFLDENTSFQSDLKIMASVPSYADFLRALALNRN